MMGGGLYLQRRLGFCDFIYLFISLFFFFLFFFVCESIKRDECARWVLPLSIADLNYRSNASVDHVLKQSQTFVKKGVDLPSILLRGSNPPT